MRMTNQDYKVCDRLHLEARFGLMDSAARKRWADHCAVCEECRKDAAAVDRVMTAGAAEADCPVPEELDARIVASLREAGARPARPQFLRPVFAAAAFLLLAGGAAWVWLAPLSLGKVSSSGAFSLDNRMMKKDIHLFSKADLSTYSGTLVRLKDRYTIGMNEGSRVVLERISRGDFRSGQEAGTVDYKVKKGSCRFSVLTFNASIQVTGTEFTVEVLPDQHLTRVILVEGTVRIRNLASPAEPKVVSAPSIALIRLRRPPETVAVDRTAGDDRSTGGGSDRRGFDSVSQRIYLRSGSIVVGKVTKQENGVTFIETAAGAMRVNEKDIDRVEYYSP